MAKVMQVVNLASYALVAAIGVSALVTSLSDKAIASPAPATNAADVFASSINKGWMICNGADSEGATIVLKVKFSNVTSEGVLFQSKTLDNQPNSDLVLKRTDNDGYWQCLYTFFRVPTFPRAYSPLFFPRVYHPIHYLPVKLVPLYWVSERLVTVKGILIAS